VTVQTGLDLVLDRHIDLLQGKSIGLLVHPASVNRSLQHAVDCFFERSEFELKAVFGPQHGARGDTQDNMIEWEGYRDPKTGLPVYSLYGATREPTPAMLEAIDTLVVDLQDVGSRYYTFIYTMALAMRACGSLGRNVVVLDRPNPINGLAIEGPMLDPAFASFVGLYPLPVRHGLTIGELAIYFRDVIGIQCDLTVVPMEGWKRGMHFDETGLPWVLPSPNMPRLETALVYPGMCLLEGTNLSEGRGTTLPFEFSGAPWIDPDRLAERMEAHHLPGVRYRPIHFQPTFHKWAGHLIGGVHLSVTDRSSFKPFLTGVALVAAYRELGGSEFRWKNPPYEYEYQLLPFEILCGTDRIRKALETGFEPSELESQWESDVEQFRGLRQQSLLYPA